MSANPETPLTQFVAYEDPNTGCSRIGHLDLTASAIQPLCFPSGTPISNLYQVIEAGLGKISAVGDPFPASQVKLLPPISGRDVLAVGKNYMEHAKEFNSSGFDSSDKVALPSHPVIFTKRATSIIACGEEILPHPDFSSTVDYEGEIGVIIGKAGFRVQEADAWEYVWGYTIINDMTARERQRDHKQFFIGKSPDTFCPMGPIAVPKEHLPSTLRVQTHVNGELRQDATSDDLIFSIPTLIKTISEGQTIQPGDVIATGTPAGVGIGRDPPIYLNPGDEVSVAITGLGTLGNKIAAANTPNATTSQIESQTSFTLINAAKTIGGKVGLTQINSKPLHYKQVGVGSEELVLVHGLGGTLESWMPLINVLQDSDRTGSAYKFHIFDLEGHGLSPTHPLSELSIESFAADIKGVFDHAGINMSKQATLIAHSMGCLPALRFAIDNPDLVKRLLLLGPPPSPLSPEQSKARFERAQVVRTHGMSAVAHDLAHEGTSFRSRSRVLNSPTDAVRLSLLSQDPEGYAKGCWALANATEIPFEQVQTDTLIMVGDKDEVSSWNLCWTFAQRMPRGGIASLKDVGHWHMLEAPDEVARIVLERTPRPVQQPRFQPVVLPGPQPSWLPSIPFQLMEHDPSLPEWDEELMRELSRKRQIQREAVLEAEREAERVDRWFLPPKPYHQYQQHQ